MFGSVIGCHRVEHDKTCVEAADSSWKLVLQNMLLYF